MGDNKTTYKVYTIYNIHNKKMYVGVTKRSIHARFYEHLRDPLQQRQYDGNRLIAKDAKAHGSCAFDLREIWRFDNLEDALELEVRLIEYFHTKYPNGYNLTDGGEYYK